MPMAPGVLPSPSSAQGQISGGPSGQPGPVPPHEAGQPGFWTRLNNALPWNVTQNSPLNPQVAKQYQQLKNLGLPVDQIRTGVWGPESQEDRRLGLLGSSEATLGNRLAKLWGKEAADSGIALSTASTLFTAASLLEATGQFATAKTDLEQTEGLFKMLSAVTPGGGIAWELGQILGGQ